MKFLLKTKYNVGDIVYYVEDWDIFEAKIETIKIEGTLMGSSNEIYANYILKSNSKKSLSMMEKELYGSIQQAQMFLIGNITVHRLEE